MKTRSTLWKELYPLALLASVLTLWGFRGASVDPPVSTPLITAANIK